MKTITKIWVWFRWFLFVFPLGIISMSTSWFFYPLAELMRNWKINILWIYLDDSAYNEDGSFHEDYFLWLLNNGGVIESFWQKFQWHAWRNRMWNLNNLIKPKQGKEVIVKVVIGKLKRNNRRASNFDTATLKYIDKRGNKGWQVNEGEYMSKEYSTLGTVFIYFERGGNYYFRYSHCKLVNYGFWKGWRTIKLGTNKHRFVATLKHDKQLKWK